jgi:uncharacterized protein (TIGR03435 family)
MTAYDVNSLHVSGGPNWLNSDFYNVDARAEHPGTPQQIRAMLQTLLAERFKLKLHTESKVLPMCVLTAEKPKLHENKSGGELRIHRGGNGQTVFEKCPDLSIGVVAVPAASDRLGRPDGTQGKLRFRNLPGLPTCPLAPTMPRSGPPPDAGGPSIFSTLRDQLGLKLTGTRGPVDILVIDHLEKPAAN